MSNYLWLGMGVGLLLGGFLGILFGKPSEEELDILQRYYENQGTEDGA